VDDLLARGYLSLSVLDISNTAIARSKERLGVLASEVRWLVEDVTRCHLPMSTFDIWHDRAVFHFLTKQEERDAYVNCVRKSLKPSGQIIIATFSLDGPRSCSGLPVSQYDATSISEQFGPDFCVRKSVSVEHRTPSGDSQEFLYCRLERR
jgi:SAM-dependent methyltransferase